MLAGDWGLERIDDLYDTHRSRAGINGTQLQLSLRQVVDTDLTVAVVDLNPPQWIGTDDSALEVDVTATRGVDVIDQNALIDKVVLGTNQRAATGRGQVFQRDVDRRNTGIAGAVMAGKPVVEAGTDGQGAAGCLTTGNGAVDVDIAGLNTNLTADYSFAGSAAAQISRRIAGGAAVKIALAQNRHPGRSVIDATELPRQPGVGLPGALRAVTAAAYRRRQTPSKQNITATGLSTAGRSLQEQPRIVVRQSTAAVNIVGNQFDGDSGGTGHAGEALPLRKRV